jgi:hypothetical protein
MDHVNPEQMLSDAVRDAIMSTLGSVRSAADRTGIPYTTLDRRLTRGGWAVTELRRLSAATDTDLIEAAK